MGKWGRSGGRGIARPAQAAGAEGWGDRPDRQAERVTRGDGPALAQRGAAPPSSSAPPKRCRRYCGILPRSVTAAANLGPRTSAPRSATRISLHLVRAFENRCTLWAGGNREPASPKACRPFQARIVTRMGRNRLRVRSERSVDRAVPKAAPALASYC